MLELISKITDELTIEEYHYLLSELDCCVVETTFPSSIKGITIKNEYDTGHIVYVNDLLSDQAKKKALKHELLHIYKKDFEKGKYLLTKENREAV